MFYTIVTASKCRISWVFATIRIVITSTLKWQLCRCASLFNAWAIRDNALLFLWVTVRSGAPPEAVVRTSIMTRFLRLGSRARISNSS